MAATTLSGIAHSTILNPDSLRALTDGRIGVIWHKGFYPREDCRAVLPAIVQACEAANYTLTQDLQSLGTSIGEANESEENAVKYLETAPQTTRLIRDEIFQSRTSPSDLIRLLADEYWSHGASVGRNQGRIMLPSVIRRWTFGGHANPHIDQRYIPMLEHYQLTRRIGVNVYIETPSPGQGGEIEFWGLFENEEEYVSQRRADYGLNRDSLGAPLAAISPGQGDLIMFDAARIHGVRRIKSGSRVTAACFLGVRSPNDQLVVFA
jgi:hypothetical protein